MCVLRLADLRPPLVPARLGLSGDDAAHRIAVEWDRPGGIETGVWVLRRDAEQRSLVLAGGRLFPGVHGRAEFIVADDGHRLDVAMRTRDGLTVEASATPSTTWTSVLFDSPADASDFYAADVRGGILGRRGDVEVVDTTGCRSRFAEPMAVDAHTAFFDDHLPTGSARLDHAVLLRDVAGAWRAVS